ncbi:MAG: Spore germination protein YndE [Pelotomaculum sp. PtaU1.Bin035]|nr:MAG: Spore germination protein YndE [Pelotomaculum sp. PtaU1.Bin035]
MLAMSNMAKDFMPYPRQLLEIGGPAAWMTPLGGLVVALAGIYLMSLVLKKSPGNTIIEATEQAFGPLVGTALNILIIVSVLEMTGALFMREYSDAMLTTTLRGAPISVVGAVFLAMSVLGAYLGIEAVARVSRLFYLYVLGGILILILSLTPYWNVHNFLPIFGEGLPKVIFQGAYKTSTITEIILAAVIIQAMGGSVKNFTKIGCYSMLIGFGILILILATVVLTYTWQVGEEFTLPLLRLARTIYLGRFFQRLEAIYILFWSIVGAIKISLCLYGAAASLARSLKLPDYRPLLWPLGLAMYILCLLPPDMSDAIRLEDFLRTLLLIPNYFLPLFILAAYWFKGGLQRAGS